MRAAWYTSNGKAQDVLQLGELPTPEPGPGEVRVRLAVSGVNPSDVKSRAGSRPVRPGELIVPHSDGAGTVDKVGPGVPAGREGERVWVWNGQWRRPLGTCAEFIVLPAAQAVPLPGNVSFEAGACLGIPALTAVHAVERLGDVQGRAVLVTGAASGVGYYAAQMARLRGARVIGTVGSGEKAAALAGVGIADAVYYKTEPVAERILALTDGEGVHGIVDMDFSTTAALLPQGVLAPHGRYVGYGSNERGGIPVDFGTCLTRSLGLQFFLVYDLQAEARERAVRDVNALLAADSLSHLIAPAYGLDDVAAAHQAVEGGCLLGNVVVRLPG